MNPTAIAAVASEGMSITAFLALLGFILTCVGVAWTGFKFIGASSDSVRRELTVKIEGTRDTLVTKIETVLSQCDERINHNRDSQEQRLEALSTRESTARHKMGNDLQQIVSKVEQAVARLERDTVSKDDFRSLSLKLDTVISNQADIKVLGNKIENLKEQIQSRRPRLPPDPHDEI